MAGLRTARSIRNFGSERTNRTFGTAAIAVAENCLERSMVFDLKQLAPSRESDDPVDGPSLFHRELPLRQFWHGDTSLLLLKVLSDQGDRIICQNIISLICL